MRVLDLFSGIGGFSLGLERAGMQTVAFCERDNFCRRVIAKHWPGLPIHPDITELDANVYRGSIDVVCGGFPCQPYSHAGKRRGSDDHRALWPEMHRVIRESQPAWIIGENVAGFVNMGLDDCLSDLESIGYSCQAFVVPACAVGARHRRDRVWIIGNANGHGKPNEPVNDEAPQLREFVASDARGVGLQRKRQGRVSGKAAQYDPRRATRGASTPTITIPKTTAQPLIPRGTHGVPHRVDRVKSLGNALVPQIPEILGRFIMDLQQQ